MEVAYKHDLNRQSQSMINANEHVTDKTLSGREISEVPDTIERLFLNKFPSDLFAKIGY